MIIKHNKPIIKKSRVKHLRIFDIDGVLVDSSHRYKTILSEKGEKIDLKHWRDNEHLCFNDSLLPLAEQYQKYLNVKNTLVAIATSRELKTFDFEFIESKLGEPDIIIGRALNCNDKGGIIKLNGIKQVINNLNLKLKPDNIHFYEDNVEYLKIVCDGLNCRGYYIPSKQGH